jgi:hypothetical protein
MEKIEYRGVIDKASWPRGAWDSEPDKVQWPDEATALPCLAVRGPGGHWCGYVGVPEGHPMHGRGYSQCAYGDKCPTRTEEQSWCDHTPENVLSAHGGITFADACSPGKAEDRGICHQPAAGEPDHVWWFGFDCAHSGDLSPKWANDRIGGDTYRDLEYIQSECRALAKQLADMGVKNVDEQSTPAPTISKD